jgi:hypothetical protein
MITNLNPLLGRGRDETHTLSNDFSVYICDEGRALGLLGALVIGAGGINSALQRGLEIFPRLMYEGMW